MSPASYQTAPPRDVFEIWEARYPPKLQCFKGAGNGIRTRDPNLGKVVLYQLSYSRLLGREDGMSVLGGDPRSPTFPLPDF